MLPLTEQLQQKLKQQAQRLDQLQPDWPCDGGPTAWAIDDGVELTRLGNGGPFDPEQAAKCPKCGKPHIIIIKEIVVLPDGRKIPTGIYRQEKEAAHALACRTTQAETPRAGGTTRPPEGIA